MTALTLYSRPGCHLCDDMKKVVEQVAQSVPLTMEVVDISTDPELDLRYGQEIPVLLIEGRTAAKFRVSAKELTQILQGRSNGSGRPGGSRGSGLTRPT
jgi:thioredoxin-related protein